MSAISQIGIKEPSIRTVESYGRRIHCLAAIYVTLFLISIVGITILLWKNKLLITLSQRSNVETLTLAFFLVLFLYIATISFTGARGAVLILYVNAAAFGKDKRTIREKRKLSFLRKNTETSTAALNTVVELQENKHETIEIEIRDEHGSMGRLRFNGARLEHIEPFGNGSNTLFAFAVEQLTIILKNRGVSTNLDIVEWKNIDDEETEKYLSLVQFACNLENGLNLSTGLWPRTSVTKNDLERLEGRLRAICPYLRSEALLPDWEYAGEHKIPIIPEPLGIISLSRTEKRVDPLASMGAALVVLGITLTILILITLYPPWVPGL